MPSDAETAPIHPIRPDELDALLVHLLATPGSPRLACAAQVEGMRAYLATEGMRWQGLRCGPLDAPHGLFFAVLLPGATAIVMIPPPGEHSNRLAAQRVITRRGLDDLRGCLLHYAQALLEPEAQPRRDLLLAAGFTHLAPLCYLERATRYPWVDPPASDKLAWLQYTEERHGLFAEVVAATYRDSLDCPELTPLRSVEDALASHRASGRFVPPLWQVLERDGRPAGCVLCSLHHPGELLEIVYMGVVPALRRQGVGALLLRKAFALSREAGARRVTVVVDGRNTPAQRLYERFAFGVVGQRDAYLYHYGGRGPA